jgi:hypothetical protein
MANTLLTIDMITKEALRLAHEKATFIGTINRQFDDSFGASSGKIGDTLRIRLPSQYTLREGSRVMDVQDSVQVSTALVVAQQDGVDMRFNSRELALDLDSFSQLHLEPAMATLMSNIDYKALRDCTKSTFNIAGIPSSTISSLSTPGDARTRLNQNLAPKSDRRIQVDSQTMASLVTGTAAYFNPSNAISEQFREGLVARTAMADYYENERIWTQTTVSSDTNSSMKLNSTAWISTLGQTVLGVTSVLNPNIPVGTNLTIAGIYDCHPETKQQLAQLKQLVVVSTAMATSSLTILPALYMSGPRQNFASVYTATSLALSTLAVSTVGAGGSLHTTSYPEGLMYHRDAYTFATAELPLMTSAEKCVRRTYDGISLRLWQAPDIRNDEMLTRIDILYGYAAIRPEWGCRLIGRNAN